MKKIDIIKVFLEDNKNLVIKIIMIILLSVFIFLILNYFLNSPIEIKNYKIRELNHNKTTIILQNPKVTCEQIEDLRVRHFQSMNWETDPLFFSNNLELSKSLWNNKNCGHVLGWFDQ